MQESRLVSLEQALELHRVGRLVEAESAYRRCLGREERVPEALHHLGNLYFREGKKHRAEECFSALLALVPHHESARFLLAASRGQSVGQAPADYVRSVFDSAAEHFDELLVESLHYRGPEVIREAVRRAGWDEEEARSRDRVVLDLGCGTGLCGLLFRDATDANTRLVGCDLSSRMVERTRERGIYDEVEVSDIVSTLHSRKGRISLAIAGDVFPYVGALDTVFVACRSALRPGGLFALTAEACDRGDFELRATGRFAHSIDYVERLASENGFSIVRNDEILVRKERGVPLVGFVCVLSLGKAERQRDTLDASLTHAAAASTLLKKAIVHHQQGRLDEAARLYEEVLSVAPAHPHARRFLESIRGATINVNPK